jgi:transcriptional regulator GlxA family with amidase domain
MVSGVKIAEIGILLYPQSLQSAVLGLTDQFAVANMMAARHEGLQRASIRVSHWQANDKDTIIERVFDSHPDATKERPLMLIVPPRMADPISADMARPYADWVAQQHAAGTTVSSVCAGSYILAEAGLLNGRSSTTHWAYTGNFAQRFPSTHVDGDKLLIDDGDIITTGGMMAWIDLGLRLIHRIMGPTIMMETARFMLVDPPGREQRHYSSFAPNLTHGDAPILKVQHWLQKNGAREVSVKEMAKEAGMEERTFLRRFQKATGLKPTEYCQHLRVGKAREMLEFTKQNIEQVAWGVGYEDPGAFRKVFHKVVGLTPAEYRQRFSLHALKAAA